MADPLSVLVVTNSYPTDSTPGDTPCIRDQVLALQARGIRLDVLIINRRKKRCYIKAAVAVLKLMTGPRRYDLIHAYYGHCGLLARLQVRYPLVITFRGSDLLNRREKRWGRLVARWASAVVVMSEEMKRASGRPDAFVIPFGVNTDIFHPVPQEQARAELGLPAHQKLILFPWDPARPEKRFDLVQSAVARLEPASGKISIITIYNVPHTDVARYMNACDALVLASDYEGAPMAIREAVACGLPVVSVDVGDVAAIIGGCDGCFLCERTVEDLADKLSLVLARGQRLDASRPIPSASASADALLTVYQHVLAMRAESASERLHP